MMQTEISKVHASFSPTFIEKHNRWAVGKEYAMDASLDRTLQAIGVGFAPGVLDEMNRAYQSRQFNLAMDAGSIQQPVTTPSLAAPLQFLQNWLPGIVAIATAARKIDEIIGVDTVGTWEDVQIVQQVLEMTGAPVPYSDNGNIPLTDWNLNFVQRSVVRNELGMHVGKLEQATSARVRVDSGEQKRASCALQLEIMRNQIGFYGYNSGNNQTYGFLTDPNLLAYLTVATGAVSSSKLWSLKTFLEIQSDLITAFAQLRTQTNDLVDPEKTPTTLTVPTNSIEFLKKTSDFGISVIGWLKVAYPMCRVVSAPQFNSANSSANVFNIHADVVDDGVSSDNRKTWTQIVPAKLQFLGVAIQAKGYEEDYVHASAGALCKRPYAMTRWTGI